MRIALILIATIIISTANAQYNLTPVRNNFQSQWIRDQSYQMKWIIKKGSVLTEIGDVLYPPDQPHLAKGIRSR